VLVYKLRIVGSILILTIDKALYESDKSLTAEAEVGAGDASNAFKQLSPFGK